MIMEEKNTLVDRLRDEKYKKVLNGLSHVEFIEGNARFISKSEIQVNGKIYNATKFIIATGSSTFMPSIEGIEKVVDYLRAKQLADGEAAKRLGEYMLMSWYDRDRDFESPHSAGECHEACPTPGYVDYGLNHGATLKVNIENGRFVFFYAPVQW